MANGVQNIQWYALIEKIVFWCLLDYITFQTDFKFILLEKTF